MSRYGHKMNTIIGPMENIKITTPTDLFIFRAMVQVYKEISMILLRRLRCQMIWQMRLLSLLGLLDLLVLR